MRSTLELKQRQRQEHVDSVNNVRTCINSITSETLRLSAKLQKREKLESDQAELSNEQQNIPKRNRGRRI